MHWFQELDLALLRFFNQTLSNPFFDALMPFASGNAYFFPAVFLTGLLLLWKGGARARLCILMLALIVGPGDGLVINTLKRAIERPRPYKTHADILLPASKSPREAKSEEDAEVLQERTKPGGRRSGYTSMPSAHAANWFAASMIFLVYFRRSLWVVLPIACVVSLSRLYNGVHYPSDVLAGAILGAGYAAAGMWALNALWQRVGRAWFPLWWARLPSLTQPDLRLCPAAGTASAGSPTPTTAATPVENADTAALANLQWLRLGYLLIVVLLLARISYIASGEIELSADEAYQWTWSKHLALSYFSKPPMIALTQWLGTHLWGDTELGVRFFSPVLAALMSFFVLRFLARLVSPRSALVLLLISTVTPLLSVGSTLMTIDPLSVFFWTLAMIAGWKAVQPEGTTRDWAWVGLWMGLGFLSKYTGLFQLLCWAVFFLLWAPARRHLRRPGPYVALLINAVCTLPVIVWNAQHDWITVTHVADDAGVGHRWKPGTLEFLGAELFLLNPVFFVAAVWAGIAFWKTLRRNPLAIYLFSMGAPLFLSYLAWSVRTRILPNWIAPAVLPMFCLAILYWRARWPDVRRWARPLAMFGFVFGAFVVILMHDTDIVKKFAGRPLPSKVDPLTRVRAYGESARVVEQVRQQLLAEGKPVFIIGGHYQEAGLLSFYLPEARTNVTVTALVYALHHDTPKSQFYFWPSYKDERKGQNALYVKELRNPPLVEGWFRKWLSGETDLSRHAPESRPPPPQLLRDFESIRDLGQFQALYRDRVFHTYQIFECRNLK